MPDALGKAMRWRDRAAECGRLAEMMGSVEGEIELGNCLSADRGALHRAGGRRRDMRSATCRARRTAPPKSARAGEKEVAN
jgi:hypothetical protein